MTNPRSLAECYAILEIRPGCPRSEVRRAYQRMVMLWHPDRFLPGSDLNAEAEEKIKAINEAYAALLEAPEEAPRVVLPSPVPSPDPPGPASTSGFSPILVGAGVLGLSGVLWMLFRSDPVLERSVPPPPREASGLSPMALSKPAGPVPTSLTIHEPGVVIFTPTQREQDESTGDRAKTIALFMQNAESVKKNLEHLRSDIPVYVTDVDEIKLGYVTISRNQTCGFGYIIFNPPKPPKVLESLQAIDEMLLKVNDVFHPAGTGTPGKPPEEPAAKEPSSDLLDPIDSKTGKP